MRAMRWLAMVCALATGALAGCAAVPMASLEADAAAKKFQAPPGMANIYLYRNETFGAAIAMTVSLNGKVMGRTGPQTYFLWEVPPGRHEIQSHTENTSRITIDAQAGRNYYVWQEVKMGMWQPGSLLQEMSEAEGRKGVLECQRATAEN
jgi:hypothetical protein